MGISRGASSIARKSIIQSTASLAKIDDVVDATQAYKKSCYFEIDFTILEDSTVYEAVQKFSAFDIGALVVVDSKGDITGVVSERDYVAKIALLGRTSKETTIKEIATRPS